MKKCSLAARLVLPGFAASLMAQAPAPVAAGRPNNIRPGIAMVSGENPGIRLYDKEGSKILSAVSYWRIYWSPVGSGHLCFVTVGSQGEPGAQRFALYDNEKLLDFMINEVVGLTNKTYKDWPYERVGGSTFQLGGDAMHEVTESCTSPKYQVQLAWHDLQAPEMLDIQPGSRPNNPFGIVAIRLPAKGADVTINGKKAPGITYGASSFEIYGESWIKKE
jgi:hypothetical protein